MTFDLRSDFKVANTGVMEPFEGMVFRWRQGTLQGWIILGFEDARAPPRAVNRPRSSGASWW